MAKPNPNDAPANFDDLLGDGADAPAEAAPENFDELLAAPEEPQETPEQRRIRELEAELAKPLVIQNKAGDPVFIDAEKTPEQIRIEELENQLAIRKAKELDQQAETFTTPTGDDLIYLHVEEDGFTAFERVWLRGQNLILTPADYERTKDRFGNSWVDSLLHNPQKQYETWGKVYVGPGPFVPRPGEVFEDAIAKEDERRQGAVPAASR